MQFLVLATLSDKVKYEEMASLIHEETRMSWELYKSDAVRSIHHRQDVRGVAIMFEADSKEFVQKAMDSLPLAKAGFLSIDMIIPLKPYTSWERLFRATD